MYVSLTPVFRKFVTDRTFGLFSPKVQSYYRPFPIGEEFVVKVDGGKVTVQSPSGHEVFSGSPQDAALLAEKLEVALCIKER